MKLGNNRWLNTDARARIEPPPIPLVKATSGKTEETDTIKIKMRLDPASATSETYKLKIQTFENSTPEEFLQMMKDLNTGIEGKATTYATGKNQCLLTMLGGEALREFDVITGQVLSTNTTHLKQINEGLLSYPPPLNVLNNQNLHEAYHEKTLRSPAQKICSTTNGIKQLPSAFPWIEQRQEDGP